MGNAIFIRKRRVRTLEAPPRRPAPPSRRVLGTRLTADGWCAQLLVPDPPEGPGASTHHHSPPQP
eukprot:2010625-Alexandrium_andersonii.AAC.1